MDFKEQIKILSDRALGLNIKFKSIFLIKEQYNATADNLLLKNRK